MCLVLVNSDLSSTLEQGLQSSFQKNGSPLYNQEVDCQCPAACFWWHLIAQSAGSCQCASLLVSMHGWHGHPSSSSDSPYPSSVPHLILSRGFEGQAAQDRIKWAKPEHEQCRERPCSSVSCWDNKLTYCSEDRQVKVSTLSAIHTDFTQRTLKGN